MITNDEHINIKFLCLNVRVKVRVRVCIDKIMREIQRGLNNKVSKGVHKVKDSRQKWKLSHKQRMLIIKKFCHYDFVMWISIDRLIFHCLSRAGTNTC